ncbi:MAG: GntR family transcriptional regulator [Acidobacteriota bacterium]
MVKLYLDKTNKIPMYLQLKDLIKYYISTGVIKHNELLPGVVRLAKELGINFETVRNAYKELEKEGLVSMKRGKGTYALLPGTVPPNAGAPPESAAAHGVDPEAELRQAVTRMMQGGRTKAEVRALIDAALQDIPAAGSSPFVIFTECSGYQVREISKTLQKELKVEVRPVVVGDLQAEIAGLQGREGDLLAIVTTGFHLNEVREIVGSRPIDIQILITNMSPETRNRLSSFNRGTKFGFICRDVDSNSVFVDVLKTELGKGIRLLSCLVTDDAEVDRILGTVDVLLLTPTVYEDIRQRTPKSLPVFNVFDCIDPVSLMIVQTYISQKVGAARR